MFHHKAQPHPQGYYHPAQQEWVGTPHSNPHYNYTYKPVYHAQLPQHAQYAQHHAYNSPSSPYDYNPRQYNQPHPPNPPLETYLPHQDLHTKERYTGENVPMVGNGHAYEQEVVQSEGMLTFPPAQTNYKKPTIFIQPYLYSTPSSTSAENPYPYNYSNVSHGNHPTQSDFQPPQNYHTSGYPNPNPPVNYYYPVPIHSNTNFGNGFTVIGGQIYKSVVHKKSKPEEDIKKDVERCFEHSSICMGSHPFYGTCIQYIQLKPIETKEVQMMAQKDPHRRVFTSTDMNHLAQAQLRSDAKDCALNQVIRVDLSVSFSYFLKILQYLPKDMVSGPNFPPVDVYLPYSMGIPGTGYYPVNPWIYDVNPNVLSTVFNHLREEPLDGAKMDKGNLVNVLKNLQNLIRYCSWGERICQELQVLIIQYSYQCKLAFWQDSDFYQFVSQHFMLARSQEDMYKTLSNDYVTYVVGQSKKEEGSRGIPLTFPRLCKESYVEFLFRTFQRLTVEDDKLKHGIKDHRHSHGIYRRINEMKIAQAEIGKLGKFLNEILEMNLLKTVESAGFTIDPSWGFGAGLPVALVLSVVHRIEKKLQETLAPLGVDNFYLLSPEFYDLNTKLDTLKHLGIAETEKYGVEFNLEERPPSTTETKQPDTEIKRESDENWQPHDPPHHHAGPALPVPSQNSALVMHSEPKVGATREPEDSKMNNLHVQAQLGHRQQQPLQFQQLHHENKPSEYDTEESGKQINGEIPTLIRKPITNLNQSAISGFGQSRSGYQDESWDQEAAGLYHFKNKYK